MESAGVSGGGAAAVYTTTGPDQCVAFLKHTGLAWGSRRNWRYWLDPGGTQGSLMAQYMQCKGPEKFFSAPFVFAGTHYEIVTPPVAYAGQDFWITVLVLNVGGSTKTDYCGTTSFTSTDPSSVIQGSAMDTFNYTWDSNVASATCVGAGCVGTCDNGVRIFVQVRFNRLGMHTIVAADIADGSILGLATFMVVGEDVKLFKEPRLGTAASGDTVMFRICWSNYSSGSAFTFVITDAVPQGTAYVPEVPSVMDCGSTDGVGLTVAQSTSTSVPPPSYTTVTSGSLPVGVRWLRWTVPIVGVQTTGCACYKLSVD